jgi:hypothetical protein
MIHQLATRKATQELEEENGWLCAATVDRTDRLVRDKFRAQFGLMQRRFAVRLGVEFQVGGKYCSFVAVEAKEGKITEKRKNALDATMSRDIENEREDWEMVPDMDEQDFSGMSAFPRLVAKYSEPLHPSLSAPQIARFEFANIPPPSAEQECAPVRGGLSRGMALRKQLASKAAYKSSTLYEEEE